jgi:hypothetical protein
MKYFKLLPRIILKEHQKLRFFNLSKFRIRNNFQTCFSRNIIHNAILIPNKLVILDLFFNIFLFNKLIITYIF